MGDAWRNPPIGPWQKMFTFSWSVSFKRNPPIPKKGHNIKPQVFGGIDHCSKVKSKGSTNHALIQFHSYSTQQPPHLVVEFQYGRTVTSHQAPFCPANQPESQHEMGECPNGALGGGLTTGSSMGNEEFLATEKQKTKKTPVATHSNQKRYLEFLG